MAFKKPPTATISGKAKEITNYINELSYVIFTGFRRIVSNMRNED